MLRLDVRELGKQVASGLLHWDGIWVCKGNLGGTI